ncbi:PREDICTED: HSPB1-associated protein 1 isoform X2 [Chinchilla lanigera]|uniref:HSPB1-associated protein 1 isoform X2 n=1 Tax=Chinchilla lanigera TaxID=34839 RepID=UPI00038ED40B|nr:PREDICTED: HSPB1-associated protein 1 isoform X2 [Chinchilla lanigera]
MQRKAVAWGLQTAPHTEHVLGAAPPPRTKTNRRGSAPHSHVNAEPRFRASPRGAGVLPGTHAEPSSPRTVFSRGGNLAGTMAAGTQESPPLTAAAEASWDEGEHVKPFTPEKAKDIIMSLRQPAVFCNMVSDWPSRHWTAEHLSEVLQGKQIRFRMGMKSADTVPQFETTCSYVEATLEEFLTWNCDRSSSFGPFRDYDHSKFWAYADYKYFVNLFEDNSDVFQDVLWSDFGFPGRNGQESTLWIGSLGAHTPCHLDTYGCNLVFQVQGRKRWHLFPPEDTPFLYPTRIPYEESSVFSKVSVVNPDLKCFPRFQKARRHTVTLSPRQVLFVPRHWWHYVESIDPVTVSINSWIELEEDHLARVEEAITRMLVCALKTSEDPHNTRAWLNPTEDRTPKAVEIQALKTNGENVEKKGLRVSSRMEVGQTHSQNDSPGAGEQDPESLFGPDLFPVPPSPEDPPAERGGPWENDGKELVDKDGNHFAESCCPQRHTLSKSGNVVEGQTASGRAPGPSQALISTDDLLDCLVNPRVTRLVAQLLIEMKSL